MRVVHWSRTKAVGKGNQPFSFERGVIRDIDLSMGDLLLIDQDRAWRIRAVGNGVRVDHLEIARAQEAQL